MSIKERAMLKDIDENDLPFLLNWRNQESIREVMFNSNMILWAQHNQWFNKLQKNDSAISKIFYFDNIPYGVLNITQIDLVNNTCEWGFYIGSLTAPKGIGTILGYTALNYIFQELHVRKLFAQVFDFNDKSINFHNKMGFTQEGKLRAHILKNGQYIDVFLYGFLSSEWEEQSLILKNIIEGRLI